MKIAHISFAVINEAPARWLDSIPYHTRVIEALASNHSVTSFHYATTRYTTIRNGVRYCFLKNGISETFFLSTFKSDFRIEKPDVVVLHGMHAVFSVLRFLMVFKNLRVFVQHHGERVFKWPKSFVHRFNDHFIQGYLFSSSDMGSVWVKSDQIASTKKIFQVLEATSSFEPVARTRSTAAPTFLWVGRIDENKDPQTLIEGFKKFAAERLDARLVIISKDVASFHRLRGEIEDATQAIQLVGDVNHAEMQHWFCRSNFIVSTSLYEGSGIAVLEGISLGCVPILSNIPSFRTMTGNGRIGILFQAGSSEHLAIAFHKAAALDFTAEQKRVIDHFREHLSATAIARRIEELFQFELRHH